MSPTLRCLLFSALLVSPAVAQERSTPGPRERPAEWAVPVINSTLENCYRVSAELYRCEQPDAKDVPTLRALGIKSILNLRRYNSDSSSLERAGFKLLVQRMEADDLTLDDLVAGLRQIKEAPKPVLLHCWHGSDRTGSIIAAYRIVFQDWPPAAALDELRFGGYGYHEKTFPNIITLFETLDAAELRRRVLAEEDDAKKPGN